MATLPNLPAGVREAIDKFMYEVGIASVAIDGTVVEPKVARQALDLALCKALGEEEKELRCALESYKIWVEELNEELGEEVKRAEKEVETLRVKLAKGAPYCPKGGYCDRQERCEQAAYCQRFVETAGGDHDTLSS